MKHRKSHHKTRHLKKNSKKNGTRKNNVIKSGGSLSAIRDNQRRRMEDNRRRAGLTVVL